MTVRSRSLSQVVSVDAVSISQRPAAAKDRAIPGHGEGDLLFGSQNSQIATLVERQTRYVMLLKIVGAVDPGRRRSSNSAVVRWLDVR